MATIIAAYGIYKPLSLLEYLLIMTVSHRILSYHMIIYRI